MECEREGAVDFIMSLSKLSKRIQACFAGSLFGKHEECRGDLKKASSLGVCSTLIPKSKGFRWEYFKMNRLQIALNRCVKI